MYSQLFICFIATLCLIPAISADCLHGTVYGRSLVKRDTSTFGYANRLSALNWANLDPAYEVCATGLFQSPINLDNVPVTDFKHRTVVLAGFRPHSIIRIQTSCQFTPTTIPPRTYIMSLPSLLYRDDSSSQYHLNDGFRASDPSWDSNGGTNSEKMCSDASDKSDLYRECI
jgi:hypothetical protein